MTAGDEENGAPSTEVPRGAQGMMAMFVSLDDAPPPPQVVKAMSGVVGFLGAVSLLLGLVLAIWPSATLKVGAALVAINFLLSGVLRLVIGALRTGYSGAMRAVMLIFGMLLVIGGVVMLRNLDSSAKVLLLITVLMVGLGWIVEGVMALVDSSNARSRGWAIAAGALSLLAGIVVLVIPGWTAVVFVAFTAFALILLGVAGLVRSFTMRRSLKAA
ncbi:DUF308 domain-containing protein [Demequina capsici]|uniref:DUF308 domain-containing protein n=1 Tax=Demequina capsici TaxID=3075620 RepID=A0AA96FE83_9MICO|nr:MULTISPECIES: DUF308 domain-containing protein [unclassified Demequina]WNM25019.1 DUF308 domain-containing protein [Demequina sp. OYTSA14]WNM27925.1 DUF308 domain-containing protein [Demequina sp. PMTSA13]